MFYPEFKLVLHNEFKLIFPHEFKLMFYREFEHMLHDDLNQANWKDEQIEKTSTFLHSLCDDVYG